MKVTLIFHLLGFLVLAADVVMRFVSLRRAGGSRFRRFSKVATGLAYLTIVISGGMMASHLWRFTDAWILGGIAGYVAIIAATALGLKLLRKKGDSRSIETAKAWGHLSALTYIVFCMIVKPDWQELPYILAGFLVASVCLAMSATAKNRRGLRLAGSSALIIVVAAGVFVWQLTASRLPESFSIMQHMQHAHTGDVVSVEQLTEQASSAPVKEINLVAKEEKLQIGGKQVDGWTYNGTSPGPAIRARVGERLRVTLVNKLPVPTSIHWHGVAVPNSQDGVAGVTQDAVQPGEQFTYEFIPRQPGTYWYHSHQDPAHQVDKGLFGTLIVEPAASTGEQDFVALSHTWHTGDLTINGQTSPEPIQVTPGQPVRLRLINSDSTVLPMAVGGAPFKVLAFDSGAVNQPGELSGIRHTLAGASRLDLGVTLAAGQELDIMLGGKQPVTLRLVTSGSQPSDLTAVSAVLNPLSYGSAQGTQPLPSPEKTWRLNIDEGPGFYNGRFGWFYTVEGKHFPNGPMLMVQPGKTYEITFVNRGRDDHPMHLHGHNFQVMSIDGQASNGSPIMVDNINVAPHQTVTIRFTADNPGIWMSHCHNLIHAFDGMDLMVAYENVTTPYLVGGAKGNQPE